MRKHIWSLTIFAAVLCLSLVQTTAQTPALAGQDQFRLVQKIYVGDMGTLDTAERFRLLLEEQLARRGFQIVAREDRADAVLSGVLSLPVIEDEGKARITLQLKSLDGDLLWSGNFGPKLSSYFRLKDPLQLRAEDVANRLRSDSDKAAGRADPKKRP